MSSGPGFTTVESPIGDQFIGMGREAKQQLRGCS